MFLHNLLNVLVQIASKMGLQKKLRQFVGTGRKSFLKWLLDGRLPGSCALVTRLPQVASDASSQFRYMATEDSLKEQLLPKPEGC
jgi:hypothetical protein